MDVEKPEVTITTMDFAQTPLAGPYSAFYDCLTFKSVFCRYSVLAASLFEGLDFCFNFCRRYLSFILVLQHIIVYSVEGVPDICLSIPGTTAFLVLSRKVQYSFFEFPVNCPGVYCLCSGFYTRRRIHLYLNDCALAFAPLVSNLPTLPHPPQSSSTSGVHCASFTPFPAAAALAPSEPLHAQPSGNAEAIRRVEPQPEAPAAGDDVPLHGGVTRFWTPDKRAHLDVHPKLGRVLISQQRMLVHSGEEVTQRVKYTMRSDFLFTQIVENAVQHT
ncbi:hypothetical protein D9615_006691 [Tricholomella constricta]|uniref:Uncharacterized protein n=1 Tax=Tricholomella constricta TaxID=117010 RepID=A0A8H5H729_9AGAR|nr:hypothetical protein D9615_006691 [Tricholomella constricta]